ncbi:thiolase family protein [Alteribacter keqinensis]|uniref:acetyl-CoA C-acetyltransferase n=1 Tax=Alteribacter keqinensis TaxID=2483800 RepID=A0A3M7TL95_9BACI|nr:thiolase family protein [Alteribacter keqinensis]RNA66231.1 thiolase family protein [Alteribacter keqinensis]
MSRDDIVIVSAVRTAIGKYGGSLRNVDSGFLASVVIGEALKRSSLPADLVDEVIMGEVRQTTKSSNVARVAALRAGIPEETPSYTINRLCASSMQAIVSGAQQIMTGCGDVIVAGGTENMSDSPHYLRGARFGGAPTLVDPNTENGQQPMEVFGDRLGMGQTAENVAEQYRISREDQDAFAVHSQEKVKRAQETGVFDQEIVPIEVRERKEIKSFATDEHPRPSTTLTKLEKLKPAFREGGSVTAGNACGRNDGASAVILMKRSKAEAIGMEPLAKITAWSVAGVSPKVMGIGPVPAVQKLLQSTGERLEDIGRIELNEAFASQALAVIRELDLPAERVNVNGGAIALGHPLGATGARIVTTLVHELIRSGEKKGIATLCVGGGQGMAMMVETV